MKLDISYKKYCQWCNVQNSRKSPLCPECLDELRRIMGITDQDIKEAQKRGFFSRLDTMAKLSYALKPLDQAEDHHWLEKSLQHAAKHKITTVNKSG